MRAMPWPAKVKHRLESMGSTFRNRMRGLSFRGLSMDLFYTDHHNGSVGRTQDDGYFVTHCILVRFTPSNSLSLGATNIR